MSDIFLTERVQVQFNKLFCEDLLGSGTTRKVWSSHAMSDCVIKVEDVARSFQNINEWELWNDVKDSDAGKWLAPCVAISPDGSVLVMKRTTPCAKTRYPDRLPKFLTDTKFQNYGMYKGRFVCHDYGSHVANTYGATVSLRAAHWWDQT